jgi:putative hydrolase of the HAD superfamily
MFNNDLLKKHLIVLSPIPTKLNPSGALKHKISCILFDIYGTLFISGSGDISIAKQKAHKTEKLRKLMHKFNISRSQDELLNTLFKTIQKSHELQKNRGIHFPEVKIDRIWMQVLCITSQQQAKAFATEFELIVNPVFPMPHLKELLHSCKHNKILMGIISNAQFYTPYLFNWFLGAALEDLGFHQDITFFSYIAGEAKPSAKMFQAATQSLNNMGVSSSATLYVGNDMFNDIYPAQRAGFMTALFAGDQRSLRLRKNHLQCKNLSPDLIITDLVQLIDYI